MAQNDTVRIEFRSIRLGIDGFGLIRSAVTPGLSTIEFNGELDMTKYILAVDLGRFSQEIDSLPRYNYDITGNYFRIGLDANFIPKDRDGSVIAFGFRYGRAGFDDRIDYDYSDPDLGTFSGMTAFNNDASASWLEAHVGMKARVYKGIWLGYRASYKFGLNIKSSEFEPFLIPGYGPGETNTDSNTTWGFNYYILIGLGKN